jgi:signal transduction histidine kinase
LGAALALGRRISTPVSTLAGAAEAIARGDRFQMRVSALREVEDLRRALVAAGERVREAAADREQRLIAETKREEAHTANRAKDEFLAVLSHELRTPLATIVGWLRMLRQAPLDSTQRQRALDTVERNTRALAHMIDDLLDISRIVAGRMTLERVPMSLVELVVETVDAFQPRARAKRIVLTAHVEPAPAIVLADAQRMRQVLSNLLENALRHTPTDGCVEVDLTPTEHAIRLRVQDTGSGIETDVLAHVFERFRQATAKHAGVHGSLGLGLAIVKNIVELHDGAVEAKSDGPGRGATFTITLPLIREA